MAIISLWMAVVFATIIFIAGLYERLIRMPRWFKDPPKSFSLIAKQNKEATKFWIPVQVLFMASFFTAIVTNWRGEIRSYLLVSFTCILAIIVSTGVYFVKEIIASSKMDPNAPHSAELAARANKWLKTTGIRNGLQFISLVMLIVAVSKV